MHSKRLTTLALLCIFFGAISLRAQDRPIKEQIPEKLFKYLVSCSLKAGDVAVRLGKEYSGLLGLAPDWKTRALTRPEQELVSSCIFARTNAIGVPVQISTRATNENSPHPGLQVSEYERRKFTMFEAGFYGNIFTKDPRAYVCTGDHTTENVASMKRQKRICSLASGASNSNGLELSKCGFIITGSCNDPDIFFQNETKFNQAILVYLPK